MVASAQPTLAIGPAPTARRFRPNSGSPDWPGDTSCHDACREPAGGSVNHHAGAGAAVAAADSNRWTGPGVGCLNRRLRHHDTAPCDPHPGDHRRCFGRAEIRDQEQRKRWLTSHRATNRPSWTEATERSPYLYSPQRLATWPSRKPATRSTPDSVTGQPAIPPHLHKSTLTESIASPAIWMIYVIPPIPSRRATPRRNRRYRHLQMGCGSWMRERRPSA